MGISQLFPLPMEKGRTATYFGGHLIANSKVPVWSLIFQGTDFRGSPFQMQSIQCNNMLDVVSVFVFFLGRTMRTMAQLMLMSDGGKCNIIKTL